MKQKKIYLYKDSEAFLHELEGYLVQLEPALEVVINNAPQFGANSARELFDTLLAEAGMFIAAVEPTGRPTQAKIIRDIMVGIGSTSSLVPLSAFVNLISDLDHDALTETPNLTGLMEQIDSQVGTTYAEVAKNLYFRLASFIVQADGAPTPRQKQLLAQLEKDVSKQLVEDKKAKAVSRVVSDEKNVDQLLAELDSLIGLARVKQDVRELVNFLKVQQMRVEKGLAVAQISRHLVFSGNPGTGKTTVARQLAQIYKSLGILSKGHFIEADRATLVAGYLGQTAIKIKEIINKALGGVLFIDEAYTLCNDTQDSFGQEAIDTLLKMMEDHREDLIVIVAGYTDKMSQFIDSNPGLKSRFSKYFNFEDYKPEELLQIFDVFCVKSNFSIGQPVRDRLLKLFTYLYGKRNEQFGNARDVRNLFEQMIGNQATRIVSLSQVDASTLEELVLEDIPCDTCPKELLIDAC